MLRVLFRICFPRYRDYTHDVPFTRRLVTLTTQKCRPRQFLTTMIACEKQCWDCPRINGQPSVSAATRFVSAHLGCRSFLPRKTFGMLFNSVGGQQLENYIQKIKSHIIYVSKQYLLKILFFVRISTLNIAIKKLIIGVCPWLITRRRGSTINMCHGGTGWVPGLGAH